MKFDAERFRSFFALLPHDIREAIALARRHDQRLDDRDWLESDVERPVRHAVEIRDESFRAPEFIELLREFDIALVCADTADWPRLMDLTSDFVYCRLHGSEQLYASGYDSEAFDRWAARVRAWAVAQNRTTPSAFCRRQGLRAVAMYSSISITMSKCGLQRTRWHLLNA